MSVSGLRKNMSKGRIPDGAVMQMTESTWVEESNKNGKDIINLHITFLDSSGAAVGPIKLYMGDAQYCHVEDGKLVAVDPERFQMSANFACGLYLNSLEEAGFSSKKLDRIGDHPEGLDGQWVKLKNEISSGPTKADGTPYTNLIVDELADGPESGGKGKSKASSKKAAEPDDDEEGEDEGEDKNDESDDESDSGDEDENDDEEEEADPHRQAASDLVVTILKSLKSKQPLIANFDKNALAGGATLKQVYTTSFKVFKGKSSDKSAVTSLVNDPDFHKANAKEGLYKFDSKKGVLSI